MRLIPIYCSFLLLVLFSALTHAGVNHFYNVKNYGVREYKANATNWGMDMDEEGILYIANSDGLLVFNGNSWTLYELPNRESLKAIKVVKDKVYTAGDNCIGFWRKDEMGRFEYTALNAAVDVVSFSKDTFWSIADDGLYVYFQSFSQILQYDGVCFKQLSNQCHMLLLQANKNEIYTHKLSDGVYQLFHGKFIKVMDGASLKNEELKFIFPLNEKKRFLFGTAKGKIGVKQSDESIKEWRDASSLLSSYFIDCGLLLPNKQLIVGTLGGGIYHFSEKGELIKRTTNRELLNDNTIHRMLLRGNQIWASLANGIAKLEMNPVLSLWKINREIGLLSDAVEFNGDLYLATSQGLYRTTLLDNSYTPERVVEVEGDILSIIKSKGELLCGTSNACYQLGKNNQWRLIAPVKGICDFSYVAEQGEEFLISPSYLYITYFQYHNGGWKYKGQITDFPMSFTQLVAETPSLLWGVNPQKGIYRIRLTKNLEATEKVTVLDNRPELAGYENIYVYCIDGDTFFFSPEGVFNYNSESRALVRSKELSEQINCEGDFHWINHLNANEYWIFKGGELCLYEIAESGAVEKGRTSLLDYDFIPIKNRKCIYSVTDQLSLMSTIDGMVMVDKQGLQQKRISPNLIKLETVSFINDGVKTYLPIKDDRLIYIPYVATDIRLQLSSTASNSSLMCYRLQNKGGEWSRWSDWDNSGILYFQKLPPGDVLLEVKGYDGDALQFHLNLFPPFYLTKWAFCGYLLLVFVIGLYIFRLRYLRKRKKLMEQLQQERRLKDEEIVRLTNEQLKDKVHSQENEIKEKLRVISQKQELLLTLSEEIDLQKQKLGDKYPNKMYEKIKKIVAGGMTEEKDFLLFQNYYQEINRDFMIILKEKHPDLTSQELKFCSLIRSNLSTKDMAMILNITARTVELKRYRLKKKLETEDSVTDYILKF